VFNTKRSLVLGSHFGLRQKFDQWVYYHLAKMANRCVSPIRVLSFNQQWMRDNKDYLVPTAPKPNEKFEYVYDGPDKIPKGLRHRVRTSNRNAYIVVCIVIKKDV
jgi:hypothetical protein